MTVSPDPNRNGQPPRRRFTSRLLDAVAEECEPRRDDWRLLVQGRLWGEWADGPLEGKGSFADRLTVFVAETCAPGRPEGLPNLRRRIEEELWRPFEEGQLLTADELNRLFPLLRDQADRLARLERRTAVPPPPAPARSELRVKDVESRSAAPPRRLEPSEGSRRREVRAGDDPNPLTH